MGEDRMRYHEIFIICGGGGPGGFPGVPAKIPPVRKTRDKGQAGFTLVELVVVVAIVAVLASLAIPTYNQFIQTVKVTRAVAELLGLEREIHGYEIGNYVLPAGLADIGRPGMLDPWGRPYVYLRLPDPLTGTERLDPFSDPLNTDFDLYSLGYDGLMALDLTDPVSLDDVVRGRNGSAYSLASEY